jgi:hypothetical protein
VSPAYFEPGHTPNIRTYYSRTAWSHLPPETVYKNGRSQTELFNLVLAIPGISAIIGGAYNLIVEKSPLYDWEEIHPQLAELLTSIVECHTQAPSSRFN